MHAFKKQLLYLGNQFYLGNVQKGGIHLSVLAAQGREGIEFDKDVANKQGRPTPRTSSKFFKMLYSVFPGDFVAV